MDFDYESDWLTFLSEFMRKVNVEKDTLSPLAFGSSPSS